MILELFRPLYNMTAAVVDLAENSVRHLSLAPELLEQGLGGAGVNLMLFGRYAEENPLVLGVGPFTGTFAPSSALMVATFAPPGMEKPSHVPFMVRTGPDMKFSGIDFLVIKGVSPVPKGLFLGQGRVELWEAQDVAGKDVGEAAGLLRRRSGLDRASMLLTGPAADAGSPHAAVSTGMGGGLDKCGMAQWMALRGLKAMVFSGTGGLPIEPGDLSWAHKATARMTRGRTHKRGRGCASFLQRLDPALTKKGFFRKWIVKDLACYHCAAPCLGYVRIKGRSRGKPGKGEGFLLLDHLGFLSLMRKTGREAPIFMKECLERGLDPIGVASRLDGGKESSLDTLQKLADERVPLRQGPPGSEAPGEDSLLFGGGIPRIVPDRRLWGRRVAEAMVLGLCPIMMLRFPALEVPSFLGLVQREGGRLQEVQDHLEGAVEAVLEGRPG